MTENNVRLTTRLLRRAHDAASTNADMAAKISAAMEARYGVTHSAVDCDSLIDALDYGTAHAPTLAECDAYMAECGVFPIKPNAVEDAE